MGFFEERVVCSTVLQDVEYASVHFGFANMIISKILPSSSFGWSHLNPRLFSSEEECSLGHCRIVAWT